MPTANVSEKHCLSCRKPIKGRSDKKFCDDFCRNHYNNSIKDGPEQLIRNINAALRRNRRILLQQLDASKRTITVDRDDLRLAGFQFKYFTDQHKTEKGKTYYYCYDYGYLILENGRFLVVRKQRD
ncbi:DUF2116 family Zn-ribbon domain-containing protein [Niabella beijingensis]|uniref:DUF2116 family Zn-ribbon domain-containing protein n=1 Tax=Niabella beijingensis TaxID=2872700 RepID=UPI001CBC00D0|nr:hypothetical protein [Niabella beijingensis]MBZ4190972.1 hypothetical protein [Niabella beijingensis]